MPPDKPQRPQALSDIKRFVLCLGRKDATKNTDLLVKAYRRFREAHIESTLELILAGGGQHPFAPDIEGVVDLGLVTDEEKAALLAECLALFQPSRNESYSRVMMEAWHYGRPVGVHRGCLATTVAVEEAGGGWTAETEEEWAELFARVDAEQAPSLNQRGERGRTYARVHANWETVIDRYERALGLKELPLVNATKARRLPAIHQLMPNLTYGDAISNQALEIRSRLRVLGYRSEIYAKQLGQRIAHEGHAFEPHSIARQDGLIYHHSIGSEATVFAMRHRGPKCLVYHNITPAEFFMPYRPGFAWMLETGREALPRLAGSFNLSVGDSAYNAAELAGCGFQAPGVLPIIVNPARWDTNADPTLMQQLQDGKSNILFVGRFSPNKKQDKLVEAFTHFLALHPESRLILAGDGKDFDPFFRRVRNLIQERRLAAHVTITEMIEDAQLLAYYRTAHLFWSMSEHEGFGVPLIEAMWFDVPVLALRAAAVPETLGDAGLLLDDGRDARAIAALASSLITDKALCNRILKEQTRRRNDFLPEAVWPILDNLVERMKASAYIT
ncbi:MAG: glycosyltransferase [Pyrinomonadaceae bacterium]